MTNFHQSSTISTPCVHAISPIGWFLGSGAVVCAPPHCRWDRHTLWHVLLSPCAGASHHDSCWEPQAPLVADCCPTRYVLRTLYRLWLDSSQHRVCALTKASRGHPSHIMPHQPRASTSSAAVSNLPTQKCRQQRSHTAHSPPPCQTSAPFSLAPHTHPSPVSPHAIGRLSGIIFNRRIFSYRSQNARRTIPMTTMTAIILPAKNSRYSPTELNSNIKPLNSLKNLMSYIFS